MLSAVSIRLFIYLFYKYKWNSMVCPNCFFYLAEMEKMKSELIKKKKAMKGWWKHLLATNNHKSLLGMNRFRGKKKIEMRSVFKCVCVWNSLRWHLSYYAIDKPSWSNALLYYNGFIVELLIRF